MTELGFFGEGPETAKKLLNLTVELFDMLEARERRAVLQKELIQRFHTPVISFTLNIPGPVKVLPLVPEAFFSGISSIRSALPEHGFPILKEVTVLEKTGLEALFVTDSSLEDLKAVMTAIEDGSQLGRLFDIDVIRPDGTKVSREELGLSPRRCLLCGQPAHACSRSRRHSVDELTKEISRILETEFDTSRKE